MKKQGPLFFTPLKGKQIFTSMFFLNNDFALSIIALSIILRFVDLPVLFEIQIVITI